MPGSQAGAACREQADGCSMMAESFKRINQLRGGSLPVMNRWTWENRVFILPIHAVFNEKIDNIEWYVIGKWRCIEPL